MIEPTLVRRILEDYPLDPAGIHGPAHWARVLETGLALAEATGANPRVVELFAVFHDSKRRNDGIDDGHGSRGAEFASELRGAAFELDDEEFRKLYDACRLHTDNVRTADVDLTTCWDADRLDLGRAGVKPDSRFLYNDAAKDPERMALAHKRSLAGYQPTFLSSWGVAGW
jgi:uncharacterized protein